MSSPTVFPPEPPTSARPPAPQPTPPSSPRLPGAPPSSTAPWNPPSRPVPQTGVPQYDGPIPPPVALSRNGAPPAAGSLPAPPTPVSPTRPAPAPVSPRRGARVAWAGLGALVATALIATGFGIARLTEEDSSAPTATTPATTRSASPIATGASSSTAPTTTSGASAAAPVGASGAEPAADVAAKVAPSVVQLIMGSGTGSGIIYDKSGLIITNAHVVQNASSIRVKFASGVTVNDAVIQARDEKRDIALVKIAPRDDLSPIVFAKNSDVRVGQLAIAIGAPFGLDQTVTQGIVSALNRPQPSLGNCTIDMVQTDAPINPGNSGGALVDRQGRLIGMNTSIRSSGGSSGGNIGIGFAVPADTIKTVVDRMVKGETNFDLAYLGVTASEIVGSTDGVSVGSVGANTPASRAGLRDSDVITEVNGEKVGVWSDVRARIQAARPGDLMTLTVRRDGSTAKLTATLEKSPNC